MSQQTKEPVLPPAELDLPLRAASADVGASRERQRRRRLINVVIFVGIPTAFLWWRILDGNPINFLQMPHIDWLIVTPILFFALLAALLFGTTIGAGRSPHMLYRPEQIDVRLADVKGIDGVKEDVIRSLNLFLAHKTFRTEMGGTPRRGLLFEGAPGTGKTYLAKAMAREAGVPFLFVSATSFQSMYYGATARKIRSYFKALRKAARQEGGAIGFIEEIDAIAMARGGINATTMPQAARMTSTGLRRDDRAPVRRSPARPGPRPRCRTGRSRPRVSAVSSTSCSCRCSPSTSRPACRSSRAGWWTGSTSTCLPTVSSSGPSRRRRTCSSSRRRTGPTTSTRPCSGRAASTAASRSSCRRRTPGATLIDHFLSSKAHDAELDDEEKRDALAGVTQGYTPVMIEHLFDEALVNAVRREKRAMSWPDVEKARLVEEIGMGQPVAYTAHEKRLIATHEAGHATVAWLVAPQRRLEVLTIIKRREALGMLAHGDRDDVYTRSRAEMTALIQIAMGGQCAEELFFSDVSTGPSGDLLYATNVAAEMIGSCGMVDTLVSYAAIQNSAFSDTNIVGRVLGDAEGRSRVEELLQHQKVFVRGSAGRQPASGRGAARRAPGPPRADRQRDHRGPRGGPRRRPGARGARPARQQRPAGPAPARLS